MKRTPCAISGWIFLVVIGPMACGDPGGGRPKDRTAPAIEIETPRRAFVHLTNVTPILIGGTASDDRGIRKVTWSNSATAETGAASGSESWMASVPLAPGDNRVTAIVVDRGGNIASDSIVVRLDVTPPTIVIESPTPSHITGSSPISLAGIASDERALYEVTWSNARTGQSERAVGTGSWSAAVPLAEGHNLITLTASDTAGNTASDSVSVTLGSPLRAWGHNQFGQLGDGTTVDASLAVATVDPGDPSLPLTRATAAACGGSHTVALLSDGTVLAWGRNGRGQLGHGMGRIDSPVPVPVADPSDPSGLLTGVTAVAAGEAHTAALLADGTVRVWGDGAEGQLGHGMASGSSVPVQVVDPSDPSGFLSGVTAIAAGRSHTVALLGDSTVRSWGRGAEGQLGYV